MSTFYDQIAQNKRSSYVIMVLFVVVLALIGYFIDFIYDGGFFFTGLAFIIAGLMGFISYYNSDKIILSLSGAKKIEKGSGADIHNLVQNISIASGLPKPRIYYIRDSSMNAFATGRNLENGVICFTTGILQKLDKRELEGVIAHEMSHIGNYDIRLMSIVSVLVGSIALISDFFTRGLIYSGGRRGRRKEAFSHPIMFIIGLALIILSPLVARLIKLALGRHREFLADATAVEITRNPRGLANALRRLSEDKEILKSANGATAHLFIVNPLKSSSGKGNRIANLFSTHPPIEERVRRLEAM